LPGRAGDVLNRSADAEDGATEVDFARNLDPHVVTCPEVAPSDVARLSMTWNRLLNASGSVPPLNCGPSAISNKYTITAKWIWRIPPCNDTSADARMKLT